MSSFFSYAADGNQLNVASIISFGELSMNSSSYIARMFKPMLRRAPASNPVNVRDAFKADVIQEGLESDCHWPPEKFRAETCNFADEIDESSVLDGLFSCHRTHARMIWDIVRVIEAQWGLEQWGPDRRPPYLSPERLHKVEVLFTRSWLPNILHLRWPIGGYAISSAIDAVTGRRTFVYDAVPRPDFYRIAKMEGQPIILVYRRLGLDENESVFATDVTKISSEVLQEALGDRSLPTNHDDDEDDKDNGDEDKDDEKAEGQAEAS
ncbi:hypothetical protein C8034_v011524 [Colletotrichum sidae]|uniref:Uncharacterized protein n=1 Tax=Colletotrichum sidae TaxID=1347389 RepID=A0A4R8TJD2_9PEZI|nr:hypothetical protein C8034_v011524 [Colletotrichum sidae]